MGWITIPLKMRWRPNADRRRKQESWMRRRTRARRRTKFMTNKRHTIPSIFTWDKWQSTGFTFRAPAPSPVCAPRREVAISVGVGRFWKISRGVATWGRTLTHTSLIAPRLELRLRNLSLRNLFEGLQQRRTYENGQETKQVWKWCFSQMACRCIFTLWLLSSFFLFRYSRFWVFVFFCIHNFVRFIFNKCKIFVRKETASASMRADEMDWEHSEGNVCQLLMDLELAHG